MTDMIDEQAFEETQAVKSLLEYYRACGVDCAVEDSPRDRFADSARRVVEAPTVVEAPPPALAPSLGPIRQARITPRRSVRGVTQPDTVEHRRAARLSDRLEAGKLGFRSIGFPGNVH
jgi:hypothetical protein